MINRADAWKCSDGQCYESKQKAYNAEIIYMYSIIPKVANRQNTAIQFGKLVKEVGEWLHKSNLLIRQMKDESDVETARSIAGQGG